MVMSSSGLSSDNVPAERIRKELEHAARAFYDKVDHVCARIRHW